MFGTAFFPNSDPVTGTLFSLATFGVAFVARPLGGVVFGHFGDRVLVILRLIIRSRLQESPEFEALLEFHVVSPAPALAVLSRHKMAVLLIAVAAVGNSVTSYSATVFGLSYGSNHGFTRKELLVIIIAAAEWVIAVSIFFGALSNRVGRKQIFITGNLAIAVTAFGWMRPPTWKTGPSFSLLTWSC
nr:hypothetical protein [Rhodococcus sp. RS1C4]